MQDNIHGLVDAPLKAAEASFDVERRDLRNRIATLEQSNAQLKAEMRGVCALHSAKRWILVHCSRRRGPPSLLPTVVTTPSRRCCLVAGKVRHIEELEGALEDKKKAVVAEDTSAVARAARELAMVREREGRSQAHILQLEHDLVNADRRAGLLDSEVQVYMDRSKKLGVRCSVDVTDTQGAGGGHSGSREPGHWQRVGRAMCLPFICPSS